MMGATGAGVRVRMRRTRAGQPRTRRPPPGFSARTILPLAVLGAAAAVTGCSGVTAQSPEGSKSVLPSATIRVGEHERSFRYFLPPGLRPGAPLVLVYHGSGGDGARIRGFIGSAIERLAGQRGFVVAYPDGFEGHWNDCRKLARFSANTLDIDDISFTAQLIRWLEREQAIDTTRVNAVGYSNGGHFALRLALEVPQRVSAVAVFGASLPIDEEMECTPAGRPAAVMLVNGTADGINPYEGGEVVAPGDAHLGHVRSATTSARELAELAAIHGEPERSRRTVPRRPGDPWVERLAWTPDGSPGITLYAVHGGGHTIPGPDTRLPDWLGRTERRFDALEAALDFFSIPSVLTVDRPGH